MMAAVAEPMAIQTVADELPDGTGAAPVAGAKGTEATLGADPARLLRLKIRWI